MTEIQEWIEEAIQANGLNFEALSSEEAGNVVLKARQKYIKGNPRSWWQGLVEVEEVVSSEETTISDLAALQSCLDKQLYFIPETEEDDLPVYKAKLDAIQEVLDDCPFFEYYILPENLEWIVIESDHNEFHIGRKGDA